MKKIAYLFKTHTYNKTIEYLLTDLYNKKTDNVDIFILYNTSESNEYKDQYKDIKFDNVILFDYKKLFDDYPNHINFCRDYIGNEWMPLFDFYKQYNNYDFYILSENDIYMNDVNIFDILNKIDSDVLYPYIEGHENTERNFWINNKDLDDKYKIYDTKNYSYIMLNIYGLSNNALMQIINEYDNTNYCCHNEILIPSYIKKLNLSIDYLNKYCSCDMRAFEYNIKLNHNTIYHPLKDIRKLNIEKHAILLMSSYGIDYLNNFIKQFNNSIFFDFYIHIDGQTYEDINNGKEILHNSNIIFCKHLYNSKRYSTDMCKVEFKLLSEAFNNDMNYKYYHLCSDHCYMCHSLNSFLNFFNNTSDNFINYHLTDYNYVNENNKKYLYKGHQWWSLHNDLVQKIIPLKNRYDAYLNLYELNQLVITEGAIDETVFQNLILYDICNNDKSLIKENHINVNCLRYIKFDLDHASVLTNVDNIDELKNYMFLRKIDYKNFDSYNFLNFVKKI